MSNQDLREEALHLVNGSVVRVVDPGPLHAPITDLTVKRNEKLGLFLETESLCSSKAKSVAYPPGSIQLATEKVVLKGMGGLEATLEGVIGLASNTNLTEGTRRETARVHRLTVKVRESIATAYTIDWVENIPRRDFRWPGFVERVTKTTSTYTFDNPAGLMRSNKSERRDITNACVQLSLGGQEVFVCALDKDESNTGISPGCIIYIGDPPETFRQKVRTALSFTLGTYLIDLGTSAYDQEWKVLTTIARDAYSIGMRAFDLTPNPLPAMGDESWYNHQITTSELQRAVKSLVEAHDRLDLLNLSWAYWHARTAAAHIAPVQFGAVIEALQRNYRKSHKDITGTIIQKPEWQELYRTIEKVVHDRDLGSEAKDALLANLRFINKPDQRLMMKRVFSTLGLILSKEEDDAWARRNRSAHGMPIPQNDQLSAIRDMHLLRGVFHRMLLSMSAASDKYVDYASKGWPHRPLKMPPTDSLQSKR